MPEIKRPSMGSLFYLWHRLNREVLDFAPEKYGQEISQLQSQMEVLFNWLIDKTGDARPTTYSAPRDDDDHWLDEESLAADFLFRFAQVARSIGKKPPRDFFATGARLALLSARIGREETGTAIAEYKAWVRQRLASPIAESFLEVEFEDFWRINPQFVEDLVQQAEAKARERQAPLPQEIYWLAIGFSQMIGRHERDRLIEVKTWSGAELDLRADAWSGMGNEGNEIVATGR